VKAGKSLAVRVPFQIAGAVLPGLDEVPNVAAVDLVQRRVVGATGIAAVVCPVSGESCRAEQQEEKKAEGRKAVQGLPNW
jgi:hypothetical protein